MVENPASSSTVEIKLLRPGDEAVLTNVAEGVFDDPIDRRAAIEFLNDGRHHLAVALDEGTVVGFASAVLYVHPDKPHPELWINEVGVAPERQAQGIGKALMRALLNLAKEHGCAEAWVATEKSNEPARRLYASVGGEEAPEPFVMFTFSLKPDSPERQHECSSEA